MSMDTMEAKTIFTSEALTDESTTSDAIDILYDRNPNGDMSLEFVTTGAGTLTVVWQGGHNQGNFTDDVTVGSTLAAGTHFLPILNPTLAASGKVKVTATGSVTITSMTYLFR
jgi:hypothetical protein